MTHEPTSSPYAVPPGWYPDPEIPGQPRWWDGTRWLPSQQPARADLGGGFAVLSRWVVALVAVQGALSAVLAGLYVWGTFVIPQGAPEDRLDLPAGFEVAEVVGVLAGFGLLIATAVVWCIWQYRLADVVKNQVRRSPGMHAGSWFIPVVALWFPFQNIRDLWVAYVGPRTTILGWWWALWIGSRLLQRSLPASNFDGTPTTAGHFQAACSWALASQLLTIALAVVAVVLVTRLSRAALERTAAR